jgi:hypothetical protein
LVQLAPDLFISHVPIPQAGYGQWSHGIACKGGGLSIGGELFVLGPSITERHTHLLCDTIKIQPSPKFSPLIVVRGDSFHVLMREFSLFEVKAPIEWWQDVGLLNELPASEVGHYILPS